MGERTASSGSPPSHPAASRSVSRSIFWGLALATLVGAGLRLAFLTAEGLWLDELYTALVVRQPQLGSVLSMLAADVHPPLYFLLLRLWSSFAGTGDAALRLPSVLAGVAAIPLTGMLAGRLFGRRATVLAAWLLALAPYAISMSLEARSNSLLLLLSLASCWLLVDGEGESADARRARTWAYGLCCAALAWTHVFGLFILLAQCGFGFVTGRHRSHRSLGLAGCAGALSFLPWVPSLLGQTRRWVDGGNYIRPTGDALRWLLEGIQADARGLVWVVLGGWLLLLARGPARPGGRADPEGATASTVSRAGGPLRGPQDRATQEGVLLTTSYVVGLVFVPLLISVTLAPILRVRNALPLLPLLLAGAAAGIAGLEPRSWRRAGAALGCLVSLGVCLDAVVFAPPREMWRELAALVRQERDPGEGLLGNHPDLWTHYLGESPRPLGLPGEEEAQLWRLLWGMDRGWLLVGHEERPGLWQALDEQAEVTREESWLGVRFARFRYPDQPVPVAAFTVPEDAMREQPAGASAPRLAFYWESAAWIELPERASAGRCAVELTGAGGAVAGERARLAIEWSGAQSGPLGVVEVELPAVSGVVQGAALALPADEALTLTLRFVNDGGALDEQGQVIEDRNAFVERVRVRC